MGNPSLVFGRCSGMESSRNWFEELRNCLEVYRNMHPCLLSGGPARRDKGEAGRRHRERVEPFDTSGALGTGRVDAPGREQRGSVCPDVSTRERS